MTSYIIIFVVKVTGILQSRGQVTIKHSPIQLQDVGYLFLGDGLSGSLSDSLSLLGLGSGLRGGGGHNAESVLLGGLVVSGGSVVGRGGMVGGSGVVDGSGLVGGSGLVHDGGGLISDGSGLVSNGSGLVSDGGRLISRCGGSLVSWGGGSLVGGCGVGGGLVGGSVGIHSLTLILDIGNISFRASTVGNNLYSAIGKVHSVLSSGVVVGPLLLLGEDGSVVGGIVYSILVVVVDWSSNVGILVLSIRSRSWGSRVGSADKGSEKNLNNIRHETLCTAMNQIYIFHTQILVDEFLQYLVKAKNSCCVGGGFSLNSPYQI